MSVYRKIWCRKPGRGWYCTYAEGHLGTCDAWPEWWLVVWWEVEDFFSAVFAKSTRKRKRK